MFISIDCFANGTPESEFNIIDLVSHEIIVYSDCTQFISYDVDTQANLDKLVISAEDCGSYNVFPTQLTQAPGKRLDVEFQADAITGETDSDNGDCKLRSMTFADELVTTNDSQMVVFVDCKPSSFLPRG